MLNLVKKIRGFAVKEVLILMTIPVMTALAQETAFAQAVNGAYVPHVESATLYPDMARLEIREKARPERLPSGETVLSIYLPGSADPATLSAGVDGQIIGSNIQKLEKDDDTDPILAPWKAALKAAEQEKNRLEAELAAVNARIAMWEDPSMFKAATAAELTRLDQAMQEGLKAANDLLLELTPLLAEAEKKVVFAKKQLDRLSPSYKIDLVLARLQQGSEFSYSYMLRGCGWNPVYTLNAFPETGKINFVFSAQLHQQSGFAWKDARIELATSAPSQTVAPLSLESWHIRPASRNEAARSLEKNAAMGVGRAPQDDLIMVSEEDAVFAAPQAVSFSTYTVWDMGKRTLPDNSPALMSIKEEALDADFYYITRPQIAEKTYLAAKLKPDQADPAEEIYPQTQAVFMVEGNMVGTDIYPPEYESDLFFGDAPQVEVSCVELENISNEKGFLGKSEVHGWRWKFTVENQSSRSIKLRVEDSLPIRGDARIEIKHSSSPAPLVDEIGTLYFWETELDAGGKYEIEHRVDASAPADVGLNSNR